ncbi:MAG TPA: O-antigen ligase family protein, partial [Sumerlaeia bacterium]|nr:O-antigen ligase family protein [Sumerlaeia bacterium]
LAADGTPAGETVLLGPLAWPLGLVFLTAFLACCFSMAPEFSWHELRSQLLEFALVYLAAVNLLGHPAWRRRVVWALFVAGVASAFMGVAGYYGGFSGYFQGSGAKAGRALGSLVSYTRSAMYFILWVPAMAALLLHGGGRPAKGGVRKGWLRIVLAAGIALAWWFLLLSSTRGAIGVTAVACVGLAAARHWKGAAVATVLLLATALVLPTSRARLAASIRDVSDLDQLLSKRLDLWKTGGRVVRDHPWVGIGYGSDIFQEDAVKAVYPLVNYKDQPDTHMFYLQAACEGGVPHLLALLLFFGAFLVLGGRALRRTWAAGPGLDRAILLGTLTGVAAMLVYGLVGHFHETRVALVMWYLVGLGCAAAFSAPGVKDQEEGVNG